MSTTTKTALPKLSKQQLKLAEDVKHKALMRRLKREKRALQKRLAPVPVTPEDIHRRAEAFKDILYTATDGWTEFAGPWNHPIDVKDDAGKTIDHRAPTADEVCMFEVDIQPGVDFEFEIDARGDMIEQAALKLQEFGERLCEMAQALRDDKADLEQQLTERAEGHYADDPPSDWNEWMF